MKTVIRISNDYQSSISHNQWREDINYFSNEIQVHCSISNIDYTNTVRENQTYTPSKADLPKVKIIEAKGYCQGEWQEYKLRYACEDDNKNLVALIELLERTFTHKNDYWVEKFERAEIDGKNFDADPHDFEHFYIDHIEFPEKEDVLKAYIEIWGKDFDEFEINID
jgi:hypothetical protein